MATSSTRIRGLPSCSLRAVVVVAAILLCVGCSSLSAATRTWCLSAYPRDDDSEVVNALPDEIGVDIGGDWVDDDHLRWQAKLEFPERLRATAETALDDLDAHYARPGDPASQDGGCDAG